MREIVKETRIRILQPLVCKNAIQENSRATFTESRVYTDKTAWEISDFPPLEDSGVFSFDKTAPIHFAFPTFQVL